MDLNTFYNNKKYHIIYISIFEIIVNACVFALFVYGMHIQKIRMAFGNFVAGPALIMMFASFNFQFLKDIEYIKKHRYFLEQVSVRLVFSCINLITCINGETGKVYWIDDTYIRNSFLIYMISAVYMLGVSLILFYSEKKFLENLENNEEEKNKNNNNNISDNNTLEIILNEENSINKV